MIQYVYELYSDLIVFRYSYLLNTSIEQLLEQRRKDIRVNFRANVTTTTHLKIMTSNMYGSVFNIFFLHRSIYKKISKSDILRKLPTADWKLF